MEKKLFSPSICETPQILPGADELEMAAALLHTIGWHTQQGTEQMAVDDLMEMIRMARVTVVKICAAGLSVIRRAAAEAQQ